MTRLAIVTGASSGIGRGIAIELARQGWDVAFTYKSNSAGAMATKQIVERHQQRAFCACCDSGDPKQVDGFFDEVDRTFSEVATLLVNNAGVQTWAPLLELSDEDWDNTIRTNLTGSFLFTKRAAQRMLGAGVGGNIINIGSGSNKVPFPNLVDYTASKGGLEMLTRAAATELGQYGIRVNCVAPGAIEIERTQLEAPDYAQTWGAIAPLGRVGTVKDIADVVCFLASDGASYVSGQTLYVDGAAFTLPSWPYQK